MNFKSLILSAMIVASLNAGEIKMAVAANVSYAMEALIKEFNKNNPNTVVQPTFGSSGKLTAQITNGAPFDIFMSANMKYPNAIYEQNMSATKPVVYAQGALVMLSTKKLDLSKGLAINTDSKVSKIAIANPKTAPYGKATIEAFTNMNLIDNVKDKFVYAESISQTVQYTLSATDTGFIAKSTLYSPKLPKFVEGVDYIDVPANLYTPIKQGIIVLNKAKDNKEAKAFYDFMLSATAKNIMKDYGYIVQ